VELVGVVLVGAVFVGVVLVEVPERVGPLVVVFVEVVLVGAGVLCSRLGETVVSCVSCSAGETDSLAGATGASAGVVGEGSGVGVTTTGGGAACGTATGMARRRSSPTDGWQRSSRYSSVNERYGRRTGR